MYLKGQILICHSLIQPCALIHYYPFLQNLFSALNTPHFLLAGFQKHKSVFDLQSLLFERKKK